jgi:hypothetical protein
MMQTTFQNIEESLKQLPHSLQIEVFHYIEFLKSNYAKQSNSNVTQSLEPNRTEGSEVKRPKKRDGFGIWQGKISISEDFNAPMEEFEEYM